MSEAVAGIGRESPVISWILQVVERPLTGKADDSFFDFLKKNSEKSLFEIAQS